MSRRVILDTNFLLIPAQEGVDVFSEIRRVVPCGVVFCMMEGTARELDDIAASGSQREQSQVRVARMILAKKHIPQIGHDAWLGVDEAILSEVHRGDLVATMDKELRKKLRGKGVDALVLRKRQHVVILES